MKPQKGYYSLIQFCPDASRAESVNLGVILFCPNLGFLEAKISSNIRRAEKLVGRGELAREALKMAKTSIEHRLQVDRDAFKDIDDLTRFVETRGNALVLTQPRPIKVFNPAEELPRLFEELVGGKSGIRSRDSEKLFPKLQSLFSRLSSEGRAELNYHAKLPVFGQEFTVPFAYRNGVLNLVKPQRFSHRAPQQALNLAIRGDLIHKHGLEDAPNPNLVVVSRFDIPCDPEFISHVDRVLEEYSVKHIRQSEVSEFAERIDVEAHC